MMLRIIETIGPPPGALIVFNTRSFGNGNFTTSRITTEYFFRSASVIIPVDIKNSLKIVNNI